MYSRHSIPFRLARCAALLVAASFSNLNFAQEPVKTGPDSWDVLPLTKAELRTLITHSQLVAKVKVIQFWPSHIDMENHMEYPEHSTFLIDKLFRGKIRPGEIIHFVCICHVEDDDKRFVPGEEIVIFADHDQNYQEWFPPALSKRYELYSLPYSKWLDHQISERTRKRQRR